MRTLYLSLEFPLYEKTPISVGDQEREFWFRPGTSDKEVIQQVFHDRRQNFLDLVPAGREAASAEVARVRRADGSFAGSLIVDCGANIGATAVHFALSFPGTKIVAVEPEISNFELMQKNVAGLDVKCVRAAISSTRGMARLLDPHAAHYAFRTAKEEVRPPLKISPVSR